MSAPRRRPNVIFAFSDEHRWHSMSFTETPEVRTPNMARMAAGGVSFTHCISNYPVCSPSRGMLLSGRWPCQQGVVDNGLALSPDEMTLGKAFKAEGYATGYVGKWHLGGTRAEPFGFDTSLIWTGTNNHWHSRCWPAGDEPVEPVETEGYNATLMTDQALEFIDRHQAEPFFLMLSWNPPHTRFEDAPDEKKALYPEGSIPFRPSYQSPEASDDAAQGKVGFPWSVKWPHMQGYHGHVTAIDEELGRLMERLDALGLADDTIIIYTSDHGAQLGEHGTGGKRQPYDESLRVPFMAKWPGVIPEGAAPSSLFGVIDMMPTVCGLAGVDVPESCEGRDFSETLRGGDGPEPHHQLIIHIEKGGASGGVNHPAPIFRGLRTKRHTYAVGPDGALCLYDNEADPYQMTDLTADPAHADLRAELHATLADALREVGDSFALPAE